MTTVTTTVTTTEELLAMRSSAGIIEHDGDLRIECDVPYRVGSEITGLDVGGNLDVRGNLPVRGNLSVRGYLYVRGNLSVRGYLAVGGNLDVRGNLPVRGNLYVRGDYCIIMGHLIWAQFHKPSLPDQTYIKRVLPPAHQKEFWEERLELELGEGCYESICPRVFKHVIRLLTDTKWSSTERWMLETLRDSEKEPPKWIEEVRK